jgi:hypothetical protein
VTDRFFYLPEIALGGKCEQFRVTWQHLRKVAMAQSGVFKKSPFTFAALATYPRFTKGPGGKWGIFESQLSAYWSRLRRKNETNVVEATERFHARRRV